MIPVDAREAFLSDCRARRLERKTLASYSWAIGKLPAELPTTSAEFRQWLQSLHGLNNTSLANVRRHVATFYKWAAVEYDLPDVSHRIPRIRNYKRRLPRIFTLEEVDSLIAAATHVSDLAILGLGLKVGLRISEIGSWRTSWIRDDMAVKFDGKRGERVASVSDDVLRICIEASGPDGRLHGPNGPLSIEGVKTRYWRLLELAGITGAKRGPHTMRHTYGTWFIRNGGSLSVLQQQLGHSSIRSTEIYIHLAAEDVVALGRPYAPRFNLQMRPGEGVA